MKKSKLFQSIFIVVFLGLSLSSTSHALQARVFRDLSIVVPGLELSLYEWEFYLKPVTSFPLSTRPHECWEFADARLQKQTVQGPSLDSELSIVMPNVLYLGDNYFTRMGYNFSQNVNPQYCWYPDNTFFEVAYSRRNRWDFSGARSVPENRTAGAAQRELNTFVNGLNTAAFSLYQQMTDGEDNIFFSPYNVLQTLTMIYAGARNQTADQMQAALPYLLPPDETDETDDPHESFNRLNYELEGRGEGECGPFAATPRCPSGFRLNVANAFWVIRNSTDQTELQRDAFLQDYLDAMAINYGNGIRFLNLTGTSLEEREQISRQINYWASLFTQQDLQQIITPEQIAPHVNLMLTSAIYFNASWKRPFRAGLTDNKVFTGLDGQQNHVRMMDQRNQFRYYRGSDYDALDLMYAGEELSMLVLLPHEGRFRQVESRMDYDLIRQTLNAMRGETLVRLFMPRWQITKDNDMTRVLQSLGLNDLFTVGAADLSGINGSRNLALGMLTHSATITVNEDGTRAAAATEGTNAGELTGYLFDMNRPFLYIIRDVPTGTILFMGRVVSL